MRKLLSICMLGVLCVMVSCKAKKPLTQAVVSEPAQKSNDSEYDAYRNKLPDTKVERTDGGIKVTFASEVLFPTNSSYLSAKAKVKLATLAKQIKSDGDVGVVVDGHGDKTGTPEYNQWLSDKRAVSVKNFLIGEGIPEGNITTHGYGDTQPVADNKTPEGRAKNRRVELTIARKK